MSPDQYLDPFHNFPSKFVHDWRAYISDELMEAWHTFTDHQKKLIAENAQSMADNEDWD
jgi:Fe-S cluster biosynthesis and repair protein YggX